MKIRKRISFILVFLMIGMFFSCSSSTGKKGTGTGESNYAVDSAFYYTSPLKYARGFAISVKKDYKEVTVSDPWNPGKVFYRYYLVPRGNSLSEDLPDDGTVVRVPVQSIAALSSTQIGILKFLNEQDRIIAVSKADFLYDSQLVKKAEEGKIIDVGHAETLDFERLVVASPELVMVSAFMKITTQETKLINAGMPVAYNIEWMEETPLARAEWAKFIAAFFNKEREAEQQFDQLEARYNELKKLVEHVDYKPTILSGYNYKGIWYMPGGHSYLAQFLRDGKADYCWDQDTTRGSIPLSFEVVYDKQGEADIWFGPAQCRNMEDLKSMDNRYDLFKAVKTGQVYSYTKRMTPSGANDWWETGVMHPDVVFQDVIKILHPELLPDHQLYYYQQLK